MVVVEPNASVPGATDVLVTDDRSVVPVRQVNDHWLYNDISIRNYIRARRTFHTEVMIIAPLIWKSVRLNRL
jgi:hypothetical protein